MVVCGMGNVGPWVFEEMLRGVPGAGDEWQAILTHDGSYDVVESARGESTIRKRRGDSRGHRCWPTCASGFPDFWKNREMGLYELRVVGNGIGTLRGSGQEAATAH